MLDYTLLLETLTGSCHSQDSETHGDSRKLSENHRDSWRPSETLRDPRRPSETHRDSQRLTESQRLREILKVSLGAITVLKMWIMCLILKGMLNTHVINVAVYLRSAISCKIILTCYMISNMPKSQFLYRTIVV